jgi:deoxyuridine 5'-triphosphate nucleotidohydrolase
MLDNAGYPDTIICASGDLDEYSINSLKNQGAKINSWGVGTRLITSADMPALGGVYKLAAIIDKDGNVTPKIKVSETVEKITNPGFKNFYRVYDKSTGKAEADFIALRSEGVVDEAYTGSIVVKLYNHSHYDYKVSKGDKISQLVIQPIIKPDLELVDSLDETDRGSNGFGSSGR